MDIKINAAVEELRRELPAVFALPEIDRLTGGALKRRTLQNLKSKREIPPDCFIPDGSRKTLVRREPLLEWWAARLSRASVRRSQ